jgi:hypothetical protein
MATIRLSGDPMIWPSNNGYDLKKTHSPPRQPLLATLPFVDFNKVGLDSLCLSFHGFLFSLMVSLGFPSGQLKRPPLLLLLVYPEGLFPKPGYSRGLVPKTGFPEGLFPQLVSQRACSHTRFSGGLVPTTGFQRACSHTRFLEGLFPQLVSSRGMCQFPVSPAPTAIPLRVYHRHPSYISFNLLTL